MIGLNGDIRFMRAERRDSRRAFLQRAGALAAAARVSIHAEANLLVDSTRGNFRFLRGIAPYSSGATAMKGYEVVHATLSPAPPYRKGFEMIDRHLSEEKRPSQALCGIELRSPKPFTFPGFVAFNQGYVEELKKRRILVGELNPVARTNIAPEVEPPQEVLLYGFSYTAPSNAAGPTFVVAGAGELTGERLDARDIVRRGDLSEAGLRAKIEQVLGLMEQRLQGLGVGWSEVTVVDVYTVHNIFPFLKNLILPRIGASRMHGLRWHVSRPPIEEIEFEMDVRGCRREVVIG
jgi:hypothetical protein